MEQLVSFPVYRGAMEPYGGAAGLARWCAGLGCRGVEAIWGDDSPPDALPRALLGGYHLTFWPDWLDFWRGDRMALIRKFGSREAYVSFYGGEGPETLVRAWRADLLRALELGAPYAVFHVADAGIEEQFLYFYRHTDAEVIDAAAEAVNAVTAGIDRSFTLLLENQWWPGLRLTDPRLTARLLERVAWPDTGIMLDTGHLLNTEPALRTEGEGIDYILRTLDAHGALAKAVRGVHLHCSLSGDYVRAHTGALPPDLAEDYLTRYGQNYAHVLRIDRHQPWSDPRAAQIVERVAPAWLVHELAGAGPEERARAVRAQKRALGL